MWVRAIVDYARDWLKEHRTPARQSGLSQARRSGAGIGVDGCPAGWFFLRIDHDRRLTRGVVKHMGNLLQSVENPDRVLSTFPSDCQTRRGRSTALARLVEASLFPLASATRFRHFG